MSGRKVFTAGEVLQAADVNDYLMDQSVMVFAGTAARGSAIPSPSEGMVTYLSDSDQVTVFDGSAFKPVGGLVDVKSAIKTDTETFSAVAAGANVAVTGLSITHAMSNASNKLIISAFFGTAATNGQAGNVGIAVHDGSGLIAVGASPGSRSAVTAAGRTVTGSTISATSPSVTYVHSPGDTSSRTFTVRAVNVDDGARILYINRMESDTDVENRSRSVSSIVIQEVAG